MVCVSLVGTMWSPGRMKWVKLRTVLYFALVTTLHEGSASPSVRRRFEFPSALQSKSTRTLPQLSFSTFCML